MSIYLDRYAYSPLGIKEAPKPDTGIIIVIPVFNEKHTITALSSLFDSDLPNVWAEVIIIINQSVDCDESIKKCNTDSFYEIKQWIEAHQKKGISFYVKQLELPKKHAGVGLARKAGMDEAVRRFELINNAKGVILCFDADCTCNNNHLKEVYDAFKNSKLNGASLYFEHNPDSLNLTKRNGITQYELHLRYYVNGLRKAGYPYAFHTVGSSMAVRCDVYKKAGGMNRRKAGEDFHFLHKVIPFGNFAEITSTTVYPSARISDRVPFGTGKAMGDWATNKQSEILSYHPQIFTAIKKLLAQVPKFYNVNSLTKTLDSLPLPIRNYLESENYDGVFKDIKKQSNTLSTFIHRWFNWMNGLKMLHLVHYLRDNYYPSQPVIEAASTLINLKQEDGRELLTVYREMDKNFKVDQISLKHLYHEYR